MIFLFRCINTLRVIKSHFDEFKIRSLLQYSLALRSIQVLSELIIGKCN
jgi:hypothetical protein